MTGKEAGHLEQHPPHADPDALEVAPGTAHEQLEGWIPSLASDDEIRAALEKAFDYRGDVTITLGTGERVEGYIFDREAKAATMRVMTKPGRKITIRYADVKQLDFSGRDMADGRSWEAWIKKYAERKASGEKNIELLPEAID